MTASVLERNLESLAKRDPELALRLASLPEAASVEVGPSAAGEPTAVVIFPEGTQKRIHSRRDPRREARHWASSLDVPSPRTIALFGLGLGYPIEELLHIHRTNVVRIWCLESSAHVFRAFLAWKDWRWLIEDPKVTFFVDLDEQRFRAQASGGFQQIMVDGLEMVDYPAAVSIDPEWYASRRQNLLDLIRQWTSEMTTVMERGKLFQTNMVRNIRAVGDSRLFRDVGEQIRGRPAFLVSAGPSLNKNASNIARAKGKIPIVSVDTSLRILHRHGVVPDLVVSIDALGMSVRHFEGVPGLENIPLVYDLEITPEVLRNHSGPKYLMGNKKPQFYEWLAEKLGPMEGLSKGLTVAQAAFLLLAHYGASPIILVGQDLSFEREGGKTHAEGAAFQGRFEKGEGNQGKWEDPLDPKGLQQIPVLWVAANDGGEVPTTNTLYAYLKRFEEDIARTGARTVNATEGGARIQGAEVWTLDGVLDEVRVESMPDFPGFCPGTDATCLAENYAQPIQTLIEEMRECLRLGLSKCEEGYAGSDKLHRDLGWKELSPRDIEKRFDEIHSAFNWIRTTQKIQMLIDRGVMRSLYMLHKGDLPTPEERTKEQHRMAAERFRNFFGEAIDMINLNLEILR